MIDQCQLCGAAITCVEDSEECDVESMFCSVCLGHGDWTQRSSEELRSQLILTFEERMEMANDEAVQKAEKILVSLEQLKRDPGGAL